MTPFLNVVIRSAAILTDSYVAGTVIDNAQEYNQLVLLVNWTKGSLTSLELKVEVSVDGTNYFQETASSVSGGTVTIIPKEYTITTTGKSNILIPVSARYIKVSAKGTGTVTSSSLTLVGLLHYV